MLSNALVTQTFYVYWIVFRIYIEIFWPISIETQVSTLQRIGATHHYLAL
jgi:hypothetical protein